MQRITRELEQRAQLPAPRRTAPAAACRRCRRGPPPRSSCSSTVSSWSSAWCAVRSTSPAASSAAIAARRAARAQASGLAPRGARASIASRRQSIPSAVATLAAMTRPLRRLRIAVHGRRARRAARGRDARIGQPRQRVQQDRGIEPTRVADTETRGRPRQTAEQLVDPRRDQRGLECVACGFRRLHARASRSRARGRLSPTGRRPARAGAHVAPRAGPRCSAPRQRRDAAAAPP